MEEDTPISHGQNHKNSESSQSSTASSKGQLFLGKQSLMTMWEFCKIIFLAALIVLPVRYFIFQPFIVKGDSMVPNFHSGDYLIIDEISYRFTEPQRGDVVVLKYPLDPSQRFIKRIIGLPGETVQVKNGEVWISQDGEVFTQLKESYLPDSLITEGDVNLMLREGKYFVMGDNRQFSYDSRRWGELPQGDIIGKVFFRVLPLQAMSLMKSPQLNF